VLGQHPALGVLVMSYLPPSEYRLWKQSLRDGLVDPWMALSSTSGSSRICSPLRNATRVLPPSWNNLCR
jgi:hypothetical protein